MPDDSWRREAARAERRFLAIMAVLLVFAMAAGGLAIVASITAP